MYRSFSDRVLGGVCGGLAAALHVNAWLIRLIFVVLTLVSLGAFAALYLLLWWIVPAESPTQRRRGFPTIFVLAADRADAACLGGARSRAVDDRFRRQSVLARRARDFECGLFSAPVEGIDDTSANEPTLGLGRAGVGAGRCWRARSAQFPMACLT